MKKQKVLVVLLIVLVTVLSGCGKDSKESKDPKFAVGTWNENVFENTWINMKFVIPEDLTIATDEEMSAISGMGAEYLSELNGTSEEALKAAAELKSVYGFMASNLDGSLSVQLVYENLALSVGGSKATEKEYQDIVKDTLMLNDTMGYEVVEESTSDIASKTFQTLQLSVYDGVMLQDYYTYKIDNFMVSIILSYTPEKVEAKDEFIKNITELDEK